MKPKTKTFTIFVIGLLLGALAMLIFMGINTRKVMAIYAEAQLCQLASSARQLRAGQTDKLIQNYDNMIPSLTLGFAKEHKKFLKPNQACVALWTVQRYYHESPALQVPPQIKPILDALPPSPLTSCQMTQSCTLPEQDANKPPAN